MGISALIDTSAWSSFQLKLITLDTGFDMNGHWWQWAGWNQVPLSQRTYKRQLIAGSDGIQDGVGCPIDMLSEEAYQARYYQALDWLFDTRDYR
jgi:hypothetical protein